MTGYEIWWKSRYDPKTWMKRVRADGSTVYKTQTSAKGAMTRLMETYAVLEAKLVPVMEVEE